MHTTRRATEGDPAPHKGHRRGAGQHRDQRAQPDRHRDRPLSPLAAGRSEQVTRAANLGRDSIYPTAQTLRILAPGQPTTSYCSLALLIANDGYTSRSVDTTAVPLIYSRPGIDPLSDHYDHDQRQEYAPRVNKEGIHIVVMSCEGEPDR